MTKYIFTPILIFTLSTNLAAAEEPTKVEGALTPTAPVERAEQNSENVKAKSLSWGAFIDTYYAYDFNQPSPRDRAFTTQPARHNEFNVNLVYIEGKMEAEKVHGRLAFQAGTSVQSNYAGEPAIGSISGPSLSQHIQEAYAGYHLGENTWIDAGIMFSHMGQESFVSKNNLTYTRSLVADYSPYYQTGIRLSSKFTDKFSGQFLLLNGWQNISESNGDKAVGTQLVYAFTPSVSLTYNTFIGEEAAFRHFHDFILNWVISEKWTVAAQGDIGFQDQPTGYEHWYGGMAIAKAQVSNKVGLVGRFERYSDPQQLVIATGVPDAYQAWGASFGVDTNLHEGVMWRNEFRGFWSKNPVFPSESGLEDHNYSVVSAFTVAF